MPFWFLPKEVGLKGAVYADAGGLFDYQGPTTWSLDRRNDHDQELEPTPSTIDPPNRRNLYRPGV